jgi:hypothetical protein
VLDNKIKANGGAMRLQITFLFLKLTEEQEKMLLEQRLKQMQQEQPQEAMNGRGLPVFSEK